MHADDTIAAIATPPGSGGVGILRISGPDLTLIVETLIGRVPRPRHATLSTLRAPGAVAVDHGLAIYFRAPGSFTGEDVFEFHGHGGQTVMQLALEAALAAGARRAEPGEFSRRAFDNGKIDLAQAEAIADLIASGTRDAARAALRSLSGDFSARVHELTEQVTRVRMYVEAAIDFPDEDIDFLCDDALTEQLNTLACSFDTLQQSAKTGRLLRDGYRVVLAGPPNAGKSSLMNALSGDDTAIVTEIAGTTRDILKETIEIDGLLVELIDTAGLRDNPDTIEEEGIRRARRAMESADAVLWLGDPNDAPREDEQTVLQVHNKIDISGETPGRRFNGSVAVSARTGAGLDALKESLKATAGMNTPGEGTFTARQRHIDALQRARQHFETGCDALREQSAGDLLAEELRLAQEALAEITGEFTADDLLGRIFADFCIGK